MKQENGKVFAVIAAVLILLYSYTIPLRFFYLDDL